MPTRSRIGSVKKSPPFRMPCFIYSLLHGMMGILRLVYCTLHYILSAVPSVHSDCAKVAYIILLLFGEDLSCATPLWEQNSPVILALSPFLAMFKNVFQEHRPGHATSALLNLRQGATTFGKHAIKVSIMASEVVWNNEFLLRVFYEGLSGHIKDELVSPDLSSVRDDLISQEWISISRERSQESKARVGILTWL